LFKGLFGCFGLGLDLWGRRRVGIFLSRTCWYRR